ncbi:hypothetical protein D3C85_1687960 [compost metagenome]
MLIGLKRHTSSRIVGIVVRLKVWVFAVDDNEAIGHRVIQDASLTRREPVFHGEMQTSGFVSANASDSDVHVVVIHQQLRQVQNRFSVVQTRFFNQTSHGCSFSSEFRQRR